MRAYLLAAILAGSAGQATAVELEACTRTTHVSHGGEADHVDLGEGRVMWREWWSQEGTFTDYKIVECGPGEALMFRTAEDGITDDIPFDRTFNALKIVDEQHEAARVFATLPRIADALDKTARKVQIANLQTEPCACAALYPDLRGDKTEFTLGG